MAARLLLIVALVANILVLVAGTSPIEPQLPKCRRVKRCPKNEDYSYCPESVQRPLYCSEKGQTKQPTLDKPVNCKEACVCQKNFLRAANGTCIPEEQCPITCGANEQVDNCPSNCNNEYCPKSETTKTELCKLPTACPAPACKCIFNHRRAPNGTCIPTRDCPPFKCSGPNEEFNPCPPLCPTDDCSQASENGGCPKRFGRIGIVLTCNPKCRCIKGYWRKNGICVPYKECPRSCPANEEFVPCIQGVCRAKNCTHKGQNVPCPDIDTENCESGCICKEQYLRARNGSCVPEDQCDSNVCPSNEEWSECAQATCRAQQCKEKDKPIACPLIMEGYCEKACVCKQNYLRNDNGECVPEDQCPPEITCGENENLVNCSTNCTSDRCPESENEKQVCTKSDSCVPACKCRLNFRRSINGTCIPTTSCPPFKCSKPNEKYDPCPPLCPTDECSNARLTGRCPFRIGILLNCQPKCQCQDGYGRVNGTCVPFEECPNICPKNERYSTCTQAECRALNCAQKGQSIACPRVMPDQCNKGCVCEEGYLRHSNGTCVPEDKCEPELTCGKNEVLDKCSSKCTYDNCPTSANEENVCTTADPCVPACKCAFNYRRAVNGTCIPTTSCPPFDCSAKPNEEYVACPPLCPSDECGQPRLKGKCPYLIRIRLTCQPKCQCKDGYGRVDGTCVPFEACPDLCPTNEEYSSCVENTCRPQNCTEKDVVMDCPRCGEGSCTRGCLCREGYYRNDKGACVHYDECAGPMCPWAHEYYTETFKDCPPNTCESLVAKYNCDPNEQEKRGCMCDPGYFRPDLFSHCIPKCDCPQMANSPDC